MIGYAKGIKSELELTVHPRKQKRLVSIDTFAHNELVLDEVTLILFFPRSFIPSSHELEMSPHPSFPS